MFSDDFKKIPFFCQFVTPVLHLNEKKVVSLQPKETKNKKQMAKNDVRVTDNPKLKQKPLSDGTIALYLDYYFGRVNGKVQRKRKFLHLTITPKPKTPIERQQNKDILDLANKIRFEEQQRLLNDTFGYRLNADKSNCNFLEYMQSYLENYSKSRKSLSKLKCAYNWFFDFLKETPEYNKYSSVLRPNQLTKEMVEDFADYCANRSKTPIGAWSIFQMFKGILKKAVEQDFLAKNPSTSVTLRADTMQLQKDVLSLDEINVLLSTHYEIENKEIKRAFAFCLNAGIRHCDIKDLTFANVDFANKLLRFEQNKTRGHSAASGVAIPLNDTMIALIGKPTTDKTEKIFKLPSYPTCIKHLKLWVKAAGIDKHITWHCARHSVGTNLIAQGANEVVVKTILGHSNIQHTMKYIRVFDSLKQQAINSIQIPNIDL